MLKIFLVGALGGLMGYAHARTVDLERRRRETPIVLALGLLWGCLAFLALLMPGPMTPLRDGVAVAAAGLCGWWTTAALCVLLRRKA